MIKSWGPAYSSADGTNWQPAGTGFPASNVARVALGVGPDIPDLVYAFVCNRNGLVLGMYRLDAVGAAWKKSQTRRTSSPRATAVARTDIAVDWWDSALSSVYVCFGGMGDARHVWGFDGTPCAARSGAPGADLLDVEHNAIAVDRASPFDVYVGADIGVWHSSDQGGSWLFHITNHHPRQRDCMDVTAGRASPQDEVAGD